MRTAGDVERIERELVDRFGAVGEKVRALLDIALVRAYAARFGIRKIYSENENLIIDAGDLSAAQAAFPSARGRARMLGGSEFVIYLRDDERSERGIVRFLLKNLSGGRIER